ncbi:two-component system LytT family response regulator [Pedobacter sp. UYP30]|uniref:LytR/AlgR family response regulator transcription factor n=1 Tax=Pedobacter sp. UYP30 TaxID=1756400 RepID=UPI003394B064
MRNSENKYRCAIIDDDTISVGILTKYISMIPKLTLVKSYTNPLLAIDEIQKQQKLDFLFLDINMEISGLDIASFLSEEVEYIIFVTGHPEHALAAFEVYADNFLVKPVDFQKLLFSVNRAVVTSLSYQ